MLTHPLFLIGLVAVGIPIAIHLLQLRRYKKVYFSNVDMLEELHNEDRKQRNLRQLLILATRIFAIVCLVLAFCQPVLRNKGSQLQVGGTAVSVYVDNSYSMESGGMDGSLLESARRKAREIVAAYKPDDHFQLLTNDLDGAQFRWLSREEFLSALEGLQPSAVTQRLSHVAIRQNDFLRSASGRNRHAYMVSDFQRSTADLPNYPSDSNILTTFVPLGGSQVANIHLDTLVFDSPAYAAGAAVQVEVTVRNDGDKLVESLPLRLLVDERQRAVASVDVPPFGSAVAKMVFTLGDEQWVQGRVETTDYPITFDDRLFFTLPVVRRLPVTVVGGRGENPYLKRLFEGDSMVLYRQVSVGQIDYSQFASGGLVVLDELQGVPSGLAQTLHDFVLAGGSLVVVPAQGAEVDSYNGLLSLMQAPQLSSWTDAKSRAEQVSTDLPLFRGVFQGNHDDMELPSVTGHYRLATSGSTVSQSVVHLLDGSDYLTCTPVGEGYCYLFAAPLRPEHTDFVQQALFVPTLFNIALFSTPPVQPYHQLSSIAPIALRGSYDADRLPHLVGGGEPPTDLIPDIRRMGMRQCLLTHNALIQAGNYRLKGEGDESAAEGLSFNYSREESVMDFYSPDEVRKMVSDMHLAYCNVATAAQKSLTDYIQQRNQGKPLWRLFLLLTLLSLLAETILLLRSKK